MGQQEIIDALKYREDYLTPKQIQKALNNMGHIVRLENVYRGLSKLKRNKLVDIDKEFKFRKRYKLNSEILSINSSKE